MKHTEWRLRVVALMMGLVTASHAVEPVINMRNNGTGAYPDADPPTVWSATKNVKWRWEAPLTGYHDFVGYHRGG